MKKSKKHKIPDLIEDSVGLAAGGKEGSNLKKFPFTVYGSEYIDRETMQQMDAAMKLPVVVKGALMADAHVGYGLPIGGVVALYNAVMPYGVGMDIACRMCLSVYPMTDEIIKKKKDWLKSVLIENTRFGHAEFNDIREHPLMERPEFREIKFIKSLKDTFFRQLGTSGHGNHFANIGFMEVEKEDEQLGIIPGRYFAVMTHSGSRNFGAEIAKHYTALAQRKLGFTGEGAKLSWLTLDSEEGKEYWAAMSLAGDYSSANHRIIHNRLSKGFGEKPIKVIENHHNYAWLERISDTESLVVNRKGATPAAKCDTGIIPGNMISPAYIVAGLGDKESMESASHGAGRAMSRNKAKAVFTNEALQKELNRAGVDLIGGGTDEAPAAYKDINAVMDAQKDLVRVMAKFYPRIVRME